MSLQVGDVVAQRFTVQAYAASGGMGDVYRAHDRESGELVALKVLRRPGRDLRARFAREVEALRSLGAHPGIAGYVAHDLDDRRGAFLAMEWVEGETLRERLEAGPLRPRAALELGVRLARALAAAHDLGIVHRDVKPSNLLLAGGDLRCPKLVDFGVVRLANTSRLTATGAGIGTPAYMAPEQARGESELGPSTDVYGLGAVLFACLTGRPPFGDRGEAHAVLVARIALAPEAPRVRGANTALPDLVDRTVGQLMHVDRTRRPADGRAAARLLERALEHPDASTLDDGAAARGPAALSEHELEPMAVVYADLGAMRPDVDGTETAPPDNAAMSPGQAPTALAESASALSTARARVAELGGRLHLLVSGAVVVGVAGTGSMNDLARRAARCALALRATFPSARCGVAYGRGLRGAGGDEGDHIDAAAALAGGTRPGVWIGDTLRSLLGPEFELTTTSVSGQRGSWELVGQRAGERDADRAVRAAPGLTPMVGRGAVLRQLEAAFAGCVDDSISHAVVVLGEAGAGKSRLRDALLDRLRDAEQRPRIVSARGDAVRARVPYGLAGQVVRGVVEAESRAGPTDAVEVLESIAARAAPPMDADGARRAAAFLVELAYPGAESAGSQPTHAAVAAARSDPQLMAAQVRSAWVALLRGLAAPSASGPARPLVLALDDAQWADSASVDLFGAGVAGADDLPFLLLAFARPELEERFADLGRRWGRQELRLNGLPPPASERLVRAVVGDGAVDDRRVASIVARGAGNPFFLEELARAALAGADERLPASVLGGVQLRIGRLPALERQVLRAASVFGRRFWDGAVCALLGPELDRRTVRDVVRSLESHKLVERWRAPEQFAGEREYAFAHDLVREAAYASLPESDRRTGHRLAGQWLQAHGESDAIVLAEHFAGGEVAEEAVAWFDKAAQEALAGGGDKPAAVDDLCAAARYYRRAGQTAVQACAHDDAQAFFARAAALWGPLRPIAAAGARVDRAELLLRLGKRDAAGRELDAAEAALSERDVADRDAARALARVELVRSDVWNRSTASGAFERAEAAVRRALSLAERAGDESLQRDSLYVLSRFVAAPDDERKVDEAIALAERAAAMGGDDAGHAHGLWRLGNVVLRKNDLERAAALYERGLRGAERARLHTVRAACLLNLGLVAYRRGQMARAIELSAEAVEEAARIGHRLRSLEARLNLGGFLVMAGEIDRGAALAREVADASGDDWTVQCMALEILADVERCRGRERAAAEHLERAAELCGRVRERRLQTRFLGQVGEVMLAAGDLGAARDALDRGLALNDGGGAVFAHALGMLLLDRRAEARELLERVVAAEEDPGRALWARLWLRRVLHLAGDVSAARRVTADVAAATALPRWQSAAQIVALLSAEDVGGAVEHLDGCRVPFVRAEAALDIALALSRPCGATNADLTAFAGAVDSLLTDRDSETAGVGALAPAIAGGLAAGLRRAGRDAEAALMEERRAFWIDRLGASLSDAYRTAWLRSSWHAPDRAGTRGD